MAFGSPSTTLKSLVASGTVILITLVPVAEGGGGSLLSNGLKWILLFVACARSLIIQGAPTRIYGRLMSYWGLITGVLIINAFFVSAFTSISAFKAISFSLGLLCVIRLAMLTSDRNGEMLLFISNTGAAVFILSVPLLPLPLGWAQKNGAAFNGILLHPQALGVFLAMTGAASFAAALKVPRLQRELIVCGLAQWSMIYFTKCRTALFAIALGGLVYLIESLVRGGKRVRTRIISVPILALVVTGLLTVIVAFPKIRASLGEFARKGDVSSISSVADLETAVRMGSRGRQIFDVISLVEEHPLFGFGFGVDPNSEQSLGAFGAQIGGIPLSAPQEQGFLPIATIAQIGIVGSLFVLPFLVSMYRSARRDSPEFAALFTVVLGINFGEMIFYSFGGQGLAMWILLVLIAVGGAIPLHESGAPLR
jgi:hypothetical protein